MMALPIPKYFFFRLPANRLTGLGTVQLYLCYVLSIAVVAFSLTSGDRGPGVVASVVMSCLLLAGLYALVQFALRHHALSALAVALLLACLPLAKFLRYPIALLGLAGLCLLLSQWRRFEMKGLLALPLLVVAVFGSTVYVDFEYEKYLKTGDLSLDSLFHSAIAAMYKNYGVPSTGMDGLVPIGYHTLSHKIMAGLSVFSGLDVLSTYAHLFFVLGPMLLAFSLAGLAVQFNRELPFHSALVAIALMILAVITLPVFRQVGFWDSFLTSESYLMSLVLLIASLSALFALREKPESLVLLAGSMSLMVLSGLAKGSVGALGFCVLGLFGLVAVRSLRYWALLLLASVLFYLLIIDAAKNADTFMHLKPLAFVDLYVPAFGMRQLTIKFTLFMVFHYLPVWVCLGTGLASDAKKYVLSNEFLTLFALLSPALLVTLSLDMPGGAAYYFSNVPVALSFAFLAARADRLSEGGWLRVALIMGVGAAVYLLGRAFNWYGSEVNQLVLVYLTFLIVLTNYGFTLRHWIFVLCLAGAALAVTWSTQIKRTAYSKGVPGSVDASYQIAQLKTARERIPLMTQIRLENPEVLADKILCRAFWAFPAILERPLIDGLPKDPWCKELNGTYGLSEYARKPKTDIPMDEAPLRLQR